MVEITCPYCGFSSTDHVDTLPIGELQCPECGGIFDRDVTLDEDGFALGDDSDK